MKSLETIIWETAVKGNWDAIKQMLRQCPSLITVTGNINLNGDESTVSNLTLLDLAAARSNKATLKFLISKGASIHAIDRQKKSPIHYAAEYNSNVEVLKYLVSEGADLTLIAAPEDIPLFLAAANSNVSVLKYLVSQCIVFNREFDLLAADYYELALHFAAQNPNVEVVRYLVSVGANVNDFRHWYNAPLLIAARCNPNVDVVKFLVSVGANVNAKEPDFDCIYPAPLHYAVENPNLDVVKFLVSAGSDINAKGDRGLTPLHNAAMSNSNVDFVKYLVSAGADVNIEDDDAGTPLDYAAACNPNVEVLKYLLYHSAEVRLPPEINRQERWKIGLG